MRIVQALPLGPGVDGADRRRAPELRAMSRLVCATALIAWVAVGCSEDGKVDEPKDSAAAADAGVHNDVGVVKDAGVVKDTGVVADTATGEDAVVDAKAIELPDVGGDPAKMGAFEQLAVPGNPNTALHACWTEGSGRGYVVGTGGTILGWDGSLWKLISAGSFHTLHGVAASSGVRAFAAGIAGTLISGPQKPGEIATQWGPFGACQTALECDDAEACTSDWCDAGTCRHTASGAAGCCGSKPISDSFGNLAGWTVVDQYEKFADKGGVVWSAAAMVGADGKPRFTSAPKSLYFGRVDVACGADPSKLCPTFDNGKVVGSLITSQPFLMPPVATTDKANLTFQLRMDTENGVGFDALTVKVLQGSVKTVVWDKATIGGSGSTEGAFLLQVVDLSKWKGKQIQLEIAFDSKDDAINDGEGVFIDDLTLSTTCNAGETAAKGLTTATFFDVWAADDDHAWAVGTDAAIAFWDGDTWKMQTDGKPKDYVAMGGVAGGVAFAVGSNGAAVTLTPAGLGTTTLATPSNLVDVDVDPTASGKAPVAIAATSNNTVYEFDGAAWQPKPVPGAFLIAGLAPLGGGAWAAVGSSQIFERSAAGIWAFKGSYSGVLTDVASLGDGKAVAVGLGGMLAERSGGIWIEQPGMLGFSNNFKAVHAASDGTVWAVGENGIVATKSGAVWEGKSSGTSKHLTDVWVHDAGLAYAVGLAGTLLRLDGKTWTTLPSPVANVDWLAVWGSDPNDVYLSGKGGFVARFNGEGWSMLATPVTGTMRDVWGFSATDVWAVGEKGGIFHTTGGPWVRVPIDPFEIPDQPAYLVESDLYAIWGSGPADIWAAGAPDAQNHGVLVHYDGKSWKYVQAMKDETRTFRAIWGWGKDSALFAGNQGMIYRFDGKSFQALDSGQVATFFAICGWGKDALLVGSFATALRYLPPLPVEADADATP